MKTSDFYFFNFLHDIGKNIQKIYAPKNLLWQLLAIFLTYVFAVSGFDWWYFLFFKKSLTYEMLFPAVFVGGFLPILAPFIIYFIGLFKRSAHLAIAGLGFGQAALLAWIISSVYKVFTGRMGPPMHMLNPIDQSLAFRFGFYRGGIFWGWPSSHTTVAFATSLALIYMFPHNKALRIFLIIYAFYIGLGVSMSIHWFSDFVAGAILGSIIGITVGKSYHKLLQQT